MSTVREFPLGVVLSITTGKLLCPIGDVYDILNFLTGDNLFTHQLPRAMREWAQKLEAKAKYVVSSSRSDFPWQNTIKVEGDLREAISALKAKTERGLLVGAPRLATALEELGLIDEYRIYVHPVLLGSGKRLFPGAADRTRLRLAESRTFGNGVVLLRYERDRG